MNKLFTFAFLAAFSSNVVEAQILKYGAEAGEAAPDTVNWYGNWQDAGGQIEFGNKDAATGDGSIYVNTPEEAGAANDWERVLKFDGLKIKANTSYRVRVSAKANEGAVLGLALMCGDENCDMPFVLPTANGYYSQKKDVSGFNEGDFATKSALFHYTTDEYQQEIYPKVKADDPNALGPNRFLRLTVKSVGEYFIDDVIVEEAPIAACYNSLEAIKVDFGFNTNIAQLVKANGGVISLDPSCAKITVDGEEIGVEAVELKADGNLYIFPEQDIEEGAVVLVSFDATNSGIKYSGSETPGDGLDVPSFTDEASFFDENINVVSTIWEEPKLVSCDPKDGSFELDEYTEEFSFTFDKDICLTGDDAPLAYIQGGNIKDKAFLKIKETDELGKTVTFIYDGVLKKGQYKLTVTDVHSKVGIEILNDIQIMFETGKVSVAGIEYTDVETIDVQGTNGNFSENWTSYFDGSEFQAAGGGIRVFDFPEAGAYKKGFYLSQRDAGELGTALSYGEKENAPFTLPSGDVQINILASAWQGNSGNFLYELINEAGDVVVSGNGNAEVHQADQGTPANSISKISFNVENCKAGKYVLRLTTKTGGYGNAIIVWGLDIKTYEIGQGETADNQLTVDGSFAGVGNDCTPDEGDGWTVYELRDGVPTAVEKGSSTAIGQRARFFAYSNVPNLPVAYYNRNMGGVAETSYYMTYGEEDAGEPALTLDEARYNFSWYCVNWKGENNKYTFQILDVENGNAVVYSREDDITVMVNGNRDTKVEPTKIEFAWTPDHAGKYILKWFMEGESSLGNIKVEKMGSLAVYWHTQLNAAIATAEAELASAEGDQFAGATRDALADAINEAKTVTYHTGEEYTAAIERLEQYVKDMAARRGALADYETAYNNLVAQTANLMEGTKYEALDSYKQAAKYVEDYAGVEGYTIDNETLLPLVAEMQTLHTLNTNLMAENTGVAVLTDQVIKLANAYIALDKFNNGDDSFPEFNEVVLEATDEAVTDDQELAGRLKKMVTAALYKAIDKGYKFEALEFPEDEPSDDNQYIPSSLDLSGFIRNSVFYTTTAKNQPETQAQADGTCPGWDFNAPNGYAADWGWGGWSGNNQPVAPLNITNSQAGTRWGTDFEVFQTIADVPVGIYSIGGDCCDRSFVGSSNVLDEGVTTPSYIYVKQAGQDELQKPFEVTNIGQYYGMTETLIDDVTINPVEGAQTGKFTLGAQVIFFGPEDAPNAVSQRDGFASFDNAKLKMSAKHPTFDYAAAAAELEKEISTDIKTVDNTAAGTVVNTQYFDLNGRKMTNAKGILIRIDTMSDGSQRTSKVLRR